MATEVYGLVLSGGKSTRMGKDKRSMDYHGIPQADYLYHLLSKVTTRTFISLRKEQQVSDGLGVIRDGHHYKGPFNGMLSAHDRFPEVAWLVLACDLPLMDLSSLEALVAQRDSNRFATAYASKANPLPEPLCAIWEPRALKDAVRYLNDGAGSCPRKFLLNRDTKLVYPEDGDVLLNANHPEDYKRAVAILAERGADAT